jgi:hypothetical protein
MTSSILSLVLRIRHCGGTATTACNEYVTRSYGYIIRNVPTINSEVPTYCKQSKATKSGILLFLSKYVV